MGLYVLIVLSGQSCSKVEVKDSEEYKDFRIVYLKEDAFIRRKIDTCPETLLFTKKGNSDVGNKWALIMDSNRLISIFDEDKKSIH